MKNPKKPKGFTLVEMLVVIVIIAVLASVAFVAGRSALMSARASSCVSNLKQMGTVVHMLREEGVVYAGTQPGMFPGYAGQIAEPGNWREFNIYELIGEVQGYCTVGTGKYDWKTLPSETILQNPLSAHKFAGDAKNPGSVTHKDVSEAYGSYSYNAWLEGWIAPHTVASNKAKQTRMVGANAQNQELTDPSLTIMMAETGDDGGGQLFTGWSNTAPHGNYKDGAHCVFVDGHVERLGNDYISSTEGLNLHMQPKAKR